MKNFILLVSLCFITSLSFGQKAVLLEKFTNAFCGSCPDATIELEKMVDDYPGLIWISHHKPISWSETHPLPNEQSAAIWDELSIPWVPGGMVDRVTHNNGIYLSRNSWRQEVEFNLQKSAHFDIAIDDVLYDANMRDLSFDVGLITKSNPPAGPYRITAYIVEDSVLGGQHSYWNDVPGHPLEGRGDIIWSYHHRNVVRAILENHWGTADVIPDQPEEGSSYMHNYNYTIPADYNAEHIRIVAMISKFDEINNYPGEVDNAVRVDLGQTGIKLTNTTEIIKADISISPNPSSNFLDVRFTAKPSNVMILNAEGQVVSEFSPESDQMKINLVSFISGSYYLVSEINGSLHGHQFVVLK